MIQHNFNIITEDFFELLKKSQPDNSYFDNREYLLLLFIEEQHIFNSTHGFYSKNNGTTYYTRVFVYYNPQSQKEQYFYCKNSISQNSLEEKSQQKFFLKQGSVSDIMDFMEQEQLSSVLQNEILKKFHLFLTYQWTQQLEEDLNSEESDEEKPIKKSKI